eukprot:jgi/Botrbrau1/12853/Bobra.0045s0022.1
MDWEVLVLLCVYVVVRVSHANRPRSLFVPRSIFVNHPVQEHCPLYRKPQDRFALISFWHFKVTPGICELIFYLNRLFEVISFYERQDCGTPFFKT